MISPTSFTRYSGEQLAEGHDSWPHSWSIKGYSIVQTPIHYHWTQLTFKYQIFFTAKLDVSNEASHITQKSVSQRDYFYSRASEQLWGRLIVSGHVIFCLSNPKTQSPLDVIKQPTIKKSFWMGKNHLFCLELFIYSFYNQAQRLVLLRIDTDLNPFMMGWLPGLWVSLRTQPTIEIIWG